MSQVEMRDIPGYEGKYAVTADGQVWSYIIKDFRFPEDNGNGYLIVTLYKNKQKKNKRVHRLVAEAFIEKPEGWDETWDVGHKNDIRTDNRVENLYWCTRKQNLDTDHFRETQKNKIRSDVRCVETGEIFPSIKAAGDWLGKHKYGINLCLLGKQKTCGGYHWERVLDKENEK